jgi:uncharacterized RDD family membrane protein YckC
MSIAVSPVTSGAGFGIRFVARLVDLVYGIVLSAFVSVFCGFLFAVLSKLGKLSPDWPELLRERSFVGIGFGMLGAFLYHAVAEGLGSATVGKAVCGLRVVNTDGGPADLDATFKRSLAYFWDGLFFGLVGYFAMEQNRLRQRYGDRWGRTVVVRASETPS